MNEYITRTFVLFFATSATLAAADKPPAPVKIPPPLMTALMNDVNGKILECRRLKHECTEFLVKCGTEETRNIGRADLANGVTRRWELSITFLARATDPPSSWREQRQMAEYDFVNDRWTGKWVSGVAAECAAGARAMYRNDVVKSVPIPTKP